MYYVKKCVCQKLAKLSKNPQFSPSYDTAPVGEDKILLENFKMK